MIILYDSKETNFNNNGIVVLRDTISCPVVEELNGSYELELEYPLDDRGKWKYLLEGNIIKADSQLFRVYRKIKTMKGVKINARHIFYDLNSNFLEDVRPTTLNGVGALAWTLNNTQYLHPFTSTSDVQTVATKYFIRKNPVEAIMGQDGIISTWGGELVRDNFEIKLLGARGLDRGVLVSYGKNIQGIEETLDMDGLCTRAMLMGKDGLMIPERYVDSQYINNYPFPKIKVIEFSNIGVDLENGITEEMAIVLLRAAGEQYFIDSKCDIPQSNYVVDFLELSKTEEYKNYAILERVYLGDTVTIRHSKLGIDLKQKVIRTTKNVLTNRLEKVELGSFKSNIATALNNAIQGVKKEIVQVTSDYQKAIENATALITGSKGGNVVINKDENGRPFEILIMDTTDVMTAVNVWRFGSGGIGHSSTGYNGPFPTAITQDGHIVGSFITALEISGEQITAGIISSKTGKWVINLDGETFNFGNKLVYDGTDLIFGAGALRWENLDAASQQNLTGTDGLDGLSIKGDDGASSYLHIKYSNVEDGSVNNETGGEYIGTYSDNIQADSDNYQLYTWSKIKGEDGTSIAGTSSYLHIKYSNDAGVNFTASVGEVVGTYIGTLVNNTVGDSTNPADYTWALIKGADGADGSDANVPSYITQTKITQVTIESPTIIGGLIQGTRIQEVGLDSYGDQVAYADLYKNINGGLLQIMDKDGHINATIGSESGDAGAPNRGGTVSLYDDDINKCRVRIGIYAANSSGVIQVSDAGKSSTMDSNGFTGLGRRPRLAVSLDYWEDTEIPFQGSILITHNFGYKPIVMAYGTSGNVNLNYSCPNDNQISISNWTASGGNYWEGVINLY